MRNFKIVVTTGILLTVAVLALFVIKGFIPDMEPELDDQYHEDDMLKNDNDIYSQQLKQFEGEVKVLGISIYGEGTHRLERDEKLVLILESKKIELSEYEGKEVKVRGFVRDTVEGGQKIMEVAFIETIDEAGVKLFNEVGYEFSFSYPSDWEVKKEADKVSFFQKKNDQNETLMVVYQYENVKESLETWLKDRDQNLFYEEAQIKVGNTTGVRRTVKNGDEEIIKTYVKEGNNTYELRLVSQDEVIRNQYFSIVNFFKTSFVAEQTESEMEEDSTTVEEGETPEAETDVANDNEVITDQEEPTDEKEPVEEASEKQSFTTLTPLTQQEIDRIIEKGYSPFQGRMLGFDYPKLWYFSYLGDGKYGFTDDATFKQNGEEVTEDTSRVLLIAGDLTTSCSDTAKKTIDTITYHVCARETGLSQIIERMAESISKP